jgi:hypothetical protein
MTQRLAISLAATLAILLAPLTASAKGPFDGSKPLLCAIHDADECIEDGPCLDGDADDVRLPAFVRIDVKGKKIMILDDGREDEVTTIQNVSKSDGALVIQGVEGGRGWTYLINAAGETVLTVSGDGVAWAAFGDCTTL